MQQVWWAKRNLIFSQRTTVFDTGFKQATVTRGNIRHVVVLMANDKHADAEFWSSQSGIEYHLLPISEPTTVDVYPDDIRKLKKLIKQISTDYAKGAGVWSICYGGRNRSNLFLALLLIESGFSSKDAVALLKHTRKGSFQNKRFEKYLLENEQPTIMKPSLLYVIGYPGSGKTTSVRSALKGLEGRVEDAPFKHTVYADGTVQLGYEREVYGGTDGLSFNVQPKVIAWLPQCTASLVIGEGDRLANNSFFRAVQEQGRWLKLAHIKVSELVALRRIMQRGPTFDPAWIRGRMTKVDNLVAQWGDTIVTIDGSKSIEATAEALTGAIYDK